MNLDVMVPNEAQKKKKKKRREGIQSLALKGSRGRSKLVRRVGN